MYKVECPKCGGTGHLPMYAGIAGGVCFSCKGDGFKVYKTKPQPKQTWKISFHWPEKGWVHCVNHNGTENSAIKKAEKLAKINKSTGWQVAP